MNKKTKINKIKQLLGFLFQKSPDLIEKRQTMLTNTETDLDSFIKFCITLLMK
jgi:hypothetical protein